MHDRWSECVAALFVFGVFSRLNASDYWPITSISDSRNNCTDITSVVGVFSWYNCMRLLADYQYFRQSILAYRWYTICHWCVCNYTVAHDHGPVSSSCGYAFKNVYLNPVSLGVSSHMILGPFLVVVAISLTSYRSPCSLECSFRHD